MGRETSTSRTYFFRIIREFANDTVFSTESFHPQALQIWNCTCSNFPLPHFHLLVSISEMQNILTVNYFAKHKQATERTCLGKGEVSTPETFTSNATTSSQPQRRAKVAKPNTEVYRGGGKDFIPHVKGGYRKVG